MYSSPFAPTRDPFSASPQPKNKAKSHKPPQKVIDQFGLDQTFSKDREIVESYKEIRKKIRTHL